MKAVFWNITSSSYNYSLLSYADIFPIQPLVSGKAKMFKVRLWTGYQFSEAPGYVYDIGRYWFRIVWKQQNFKEERFDIPRALIKA